MEMEADINLLMSHLNGVLSGSSINRISMSFMETHIQLNLECSDNELVSDEVHRAFLSRFLKDKKIRRFSIDKRRRKLLIDAAAV